MYPHCLVHHVLEPINRIYPCFTWSDLFLPGSICSALTCLPVYMHLSSEKVIKGTKEPKGCHLVHTQTLSEMWLSMHLSWCLLLKKAFLESNLCSATNQGHQELLLLAQARLFDTGASSCDDTGAASESTTFCFNKILCHSKWQWRLHTLLLLTLGGIYALSDRQGFSGNGSLLAPLQWKCD